MDLIYTYIMISCILTALAIMFRTEESSFNSSNILHRLGILSCLLLLSPLIVGYVALEALINAGKK